MEFKGERTSILEIRSHLMTTNFLLQEDCQFSAILNISQHVRASTSTKQQFFDYVTGLNVKKTTIKFFTVVNFSATFFSAPSKTNSEEEYFKYYLPRSQK
jgi:hypothetical protein